MASECRMHGEWGEVKDVRDRISGLPDSILCSILSFLLTEEAARTSVLSKRWRCVWISVPRIEIWDYSKHIGRGIDRDDNQFMGFVDWVLRLNDATFLRSFCLRCHRNYHLSRIGDWFSVVALRHVEEIDLLFSGDVCVKLPLSIFTCINVMSLKLWHNIILNVPKWVYFPCLKILELVSMQLLDYSSMESLLAGCPALEKLVIKTKRQCDERYVVYVRSSSLKSLKITTDSKFDSWTSIRAKELLRKISKTEYLCLHADTMKCLEQEGIENFPLFHDLKHLVMTSYADSWLSLFTLLDCSPNLITLFIDLAYAPWHELSDWHPQLCPPKFSMLYIEIKRFEGTPSEMELVGYLLKNATALQKMSIQSLYSYSDKEWSAIVRKLLMFPRGSTSCQIEYI